MANDAAIGKRLDLGGCCPFAHGSKPLPDIGFRIAAGVRAQSDTPFHDLPKRHARFHLLRSETIHLGIAVVGDDQALVRIEHAQALRHMLQRQIETEVLLLEPR